MMGNNMNNNLITPAHYQLCFARREIADATERLPHALGTAIEYILRAGLKEGAKEITDLSKAKWWLNRLGNVRVCGTLFHDEEKSGKAALEADDLPAKFYEALMRDPLAVTDIGVVLLASAAKDNVYGPLSDALGRCLETGFSINSIRNLIEKIEERIEIIKEVEGE